MGEYFLMIQPFNNWLVVNYGSYNELLTEALEQPSNIKWQIVKVVRSSNIKVIKEADIQSD